MKFIFLLLVLNSTVSILAQEVTYSISAPPGAREGNQQLPDSIDLNRYYSYREVSQPAQPKAGWDSFFKGLSIWSQYPNEAKARKQQSRITFAYRINEHGNLDSAYIKSTENFGRWKKCSSCEALILDYLKQTEWSAGSIHGIPVKTEDYLLIEFKIHDPRLKESSSPFGG